MRTMRVGRPTKYSPEVVEMLRGALSDGMPIKGACIVAGICVTTLAEWREKHPELETRISEAREFARQKALQAIQAAGERDWRAQAEWLKLAFPSDYRGSTKIDVSASASVSPVIVTPERRKELIARRLAMLRQQASTINPNAVKALEGGGSPPGCDGA